MARDEPDPRHVEYVRRWKTLGPQLAAIRDEEVRKADTQQAILMFDTAFQAALRNCPPRMSSGLEEWGKLILKWRDRG